MSSPVTVKFKTFQQFDRNVFKKNWAQINEGPLKKAGLLVRRIAINSIGRTAKKAKPRPPGMPPRNRSAGREIKKIFSVVNPRKATVIIGPVGFGRISVPALHEHGEGAVVTVRKKSQRDEAGRLRRNRKGRFKRSRYGKPVRQFVKYPKRPVMVPAREKAQPMLPQLWRGSVRR